MSDEVGAGPHYETGPYVHYCEHPGCTKWGSFGFAIGRGEPNWFCSEHQPEWKIPPDHQARTLRTRAESPCYERNDLALLSENLDTLFNAGKLCAAIDSAAYPIQLVVHRLSRA